ncbi:hypothetical protein K3495_g11614 [Podosphaera aphanis]|nr:hypothetical protein K3495_g11614 [Podosphaera aphanis]
MGKTTTEAIYAQQSREPLEIAADALVELGQNNSTIPTYSVVSYNPARIEAIDAIKLAAVYMKHQYDSKHLPKVFKPGDFVALRLHRGFNVPGLAGRNIKIEQQFAGPFRVLERMGRSTYRIDLPPSMRRIHPVISVVHLELVLNP